MTSKIKISLSTMPPPAKVIYSGNLATSVSTSTDYTTIAAAVAALLPPKVTILSDRLALIKTMEDNLAAERAKIPDDVAKLDDAIGKTLMLVEATNNTDAALKGIGQALVQPAGTPQQMAKVTGVELTNGVDSGTMDLHWDVVLNSQITHIMICTTVPVDPTDLTNYHLAAETKNVKYTLTGLTPGSVLYVIIIAKGALGLGPASDPVSKKVNH